MHLELQRPTIEAKPEWHGRNGVKANKMKKSLTLRLSTLRPSTLFHIDVAEEHDKSVVPP
jgi:hypothetical protein